MSDQGHFNPGLILQNVKDFTACRSHWGPIPDCDHNTRSGNGEKYAILNDVAWSEVPQARCKPVEWQSASQHFKYRFLLATIRCRVVVCVTRAFLILFNCRTLTNTVRFRNSSVYNVCIVMKKYPCTTGRNLVQVSWKKCLNWRLSIWKMFMPRNFSLTKSHTQSRTF